MTDEKKFKTKKINDIAVKPEVNKEFKAKNVKGSDYYPEPYSQVFYVARKKSGKTTSLLQSVKARISKDTMVFIFASTVHKDDNYRLFKKWMDKQGIQYELFTDIVDEEGDNLKCITDILKKQAEGDDEEDDDDLEEPQNGKGKGGDSEAKQDGSCQSGCPKIFCSIEEEIAHKKAMAKKQSAKKKKKPGLIVPKYVFILDDLSKELKSKSLEKLCKNNRHFKSQVYLSSQHVQDAPPGIRKQMDYWIIFDGIDEDRLKAIYKDANLRVNWYAFLEIYKKATAERYDFLYIDVAKGKFRKNFDTEIQVPETE
jgi:hypothetical protein